MSYKKYVRVMPMMYNKSSKDKGKDTDPTEVNMTKAQNLLPMIYQGSSNRIDRYQVYDNMEQDPTISSSLDIIADYVGNVENGSPFKIIYHDRQMPEAQVTVVEKMLDNWCKTNEIQKRIYGIVRDCLKYGDTIFIRDPDTSALMKVNLYDVMGVVVGSMKEPRYYIIRNIDMNAPLKVANMSVNDVAGKAAIQSFSNIGGGYTANANSPMPAQQMGYNSNNNLVAVSAENVVHISTNVDNIALYPFGLSTLESMYKLYIQKMLLQDCVLMYRIKNAPDRLVFKIPVGNVPRMMRRSYMERCKNEMTQRRIPSKTSDGVFNTVDVTYDALAMNEDYWLPVDTGQIQPAVEQLKGGQSLGEITDLNYWDMQIVRASKVPQSWQPMGTTDSTRTVPTTTAGVLVQEDRFYRYCNRLKAIMITPLDDEFKDFLRRNGINMNMDGFELSFNESSSLNLMTELDIQGRYLQNFAQVANNPYISKRFAMKKWLGLTEEEFAENERMLLEENPEMLVGKNITMPKVNKNQVPGLQSIGIDEADAEQLKALQDVFSNAQGGEQGVGGLGGSLGGGMGGGLGGDLGGDVGMGADLGGEPALGGAPSGEPAGE